MFFMTNAYSVVRKVENNEGEKPVYKLFIQEGGVDKIPYDEGEGELSSDIVRIKKYGSKTGDDLWPRGPWNTDRGIKGDKEYL